MALIATCNALENFGVNGTEAYWRVISFEINVISSTTAYKVAVYLNKDARIAGKDPIEYHHKSFKYEAGDQMPLIYAHLKTEIDGSDDLDVYQLPLDVEGEKELEL